MTDHQLKLKAFVKLGTFFRGFCEYSNIGNDVSKNSDPLFEEFNEKITLAGHRNGWFTRENILFSLENWGNTLTQEHLENWLSAYDMDQNRSKTVALIMAGNIPLVGFHDFLCALLTGNKVLVKLSSNDTVLLPFIATYLIDVESTFKDAIHFTEGKLDEFDAVIATGSNNTARYFEYYFGSKPHIIRKNRNSLAVLTGQETSEELEALGEDIFRYYGLGCRSVSKLFVPKGYNFDIFFQAIYAHNPIVNQVKYANNYDYNKAVYLMSEFKILENGFLMLKEDQSYASPIATVFYEYYDSMKALKQKLSEDSDKVQCIVGSGVVEDEISFGQTQSPALANYADNVDTVEFLLKT